MSSQEITLCQSIKNKNDYSQCHHKCKEDSKFCGIHMKMNNPIIYEENMNITMVIKCKNNLNNKSNIKPVKIKKKNKNKIIKQKKYNGIELEKIKKIMDSSDTYSYKILLDKLIPISSFKVKKIRYTLIKSNLHELIKIKKLNKKELLKQYSEYYSRMTDYETNHIDKIVIIQTVVRGYITRRSFITVNEEDFYTCCTKYEIPKIYYISYWDSKLQYFFDIRSLYKLYVMYANKGKVMKNPYNMKDMPFSLVSKMLIRIAHIDIIPGYSINFEEEKKGQQSIENDISNLFDELDRLDNFTESKWFSDLDMKQLKKLYENSADLWYYRTSMTHQQRCRIVSNGHVFNRSIGSIYNFSNNQKDELRKIIIDDFYKMITEGATIDDKKLGAILVLTSLTTVSNNARIAMPQYVQEF